MQCLASLNCTYTVGQRNAGWYFVPLPQACDDGNAHCHKSTTVHHPLLQKLGIFSNQNFTRSSNLSAAGFCGDGPAPWYPEVDAAVPDAGPPPRGSKLAKPVFALVMPGGGPVPCIAAQPV